MPIFPHVCLKFNECLLLMLHKCFYLDGNVLSTANCRLVFDCSQRSLSVHGDAAIQRKKLQGQLFAVSTSTSEEVRDWWFANHGEGQMLRFVDLWVCKLQTSAAWNNGRMQKYWSICMTCQGR